MSRDSPAASLLIRLNDELQNKSLTDGERAKLLEQLKVAGRDPAQAKPIFSRDSVSTLLRYAFDDGINQASREAMRCLANAMLLNEQVRQIVIDLDYPGKVADRMKNNDRDDEFLTARLLFFATYTGKLQIKRLVEHHSLVNSLQKNLDRALDRLSLQVADETPITSMSHQETLKLLPNLVYYSPDVLPDLTPMLQPLTDLLLKTPLPTPPLQPPTTHLINALLNLNPPPSKVEDLSIREPLYPPSDPTRLTIRLISILDKSFPSELRSQDDAVVSPLLSLIKALHASAPSDDVKDSMRDGLLPADSARDQVLGKGSHLASRLLRATASPVTGNARDVICALLYELCGEDSAALVRAIGYGYAVGILTRLGKDVGAAAGGGDDRGAEDVNPVTGQRRDAEVQPELEEMTEEEKEREAERLFVLFERLKATGVMDVVNPVEQAIREGRFDGSK